MTIKSRVQLVISVSILLFVVLGLVFFATGRQVRHEIRKARLSSEIGALVSDLNMLTTDYVMRPSSQIEQQWQQKYDALAPLLADGLFNSSAAGAVLNRVRKAHSGIGVNFRDLVNLSTRPSDNSAADTTVVDAALRNRLVGQLLVLNHSIMSGVLQIDEQARRNIERAHQRADITAIGFIVLASLLSLIIGMAAMSGVVRGLKRMTGVASSITGGDLTVEVPVGRQRDEIGALMKAFRSMVHSLRRQTAEVRDAATIIGNSATDISSSIAQVTSGATETAAALTETSSTVEELKQTADMNSRKAHDVSELAENAAQASQSGKAAAQRIADEIIHIQGQMEVIGDNLTRLSEQGQNIGEIIGAVDDLSEQSNLLAVNAAIEAARAGEHGKGFTVVAEEIKSLAEQSREATRRVRTILGDIQKQTASSVMAAEEGGKAVAAAVAQETDARRAIETLADSVLRASEAATQIAVSSHEQMVGVDQVGAAMENIRTAANQNAGGMRQLEQASRQLKELGQKLVELMRRYKT
jgi:methyl-accepting chemotaxis protein